MISLVETPLWSLFREACKTDDLTSENGEYSIPNVIQLHTTEIEFEVKNVKLSRLGASCKCSQYLA